MRPDKGNRRLLFLVTLITLGVFLYLGYHDLRARVQKDQAAVIVQVQEHLNYLSNALALLSNVKTIGDQFSSADPQLITTLLNQFVLKENAIRGILLLDPAGKVRHRNNFSPEGLFINEPNTAEILERAALSSFRELRLKKFGSIQVGIDSAKGWLLFEKAIEMDDTELGYLLAAIDVKALTRKSDVDVFFSDAPGGTKRAMGTQCVPGVSDLNLTVCFPFQVSALRSPLSSAAVSSAIAAALFWIAAYLLLRLLVFPFQALIKALESTSRGQYHRIEARLFRGPLRPLAKLFNDFVEVSSMNASLRRESDLAQYKARIASQVAHDIRSPLAALEMVAKITTQLPEEKREVIRGAVGRINDIANNLLHTSPAPSGPLSSEPASVQLLASLIDPLVSEKRLQFISRSEVELRFNVGPGAYVLFAQVPPAELKRVLSNLINNAVEAIRGKGLVEIRLQASRQGAEILVRDNGRGISADILPKLTQPGATFGKKGGTGLGLYHARLSAESWGGELALKSKPGEGTEVTLKLPRAMTPSWFLPEVSVPSAGKTVVLDDDPSIHHVWQNRFDEKFGSSAELVHITTPLELETWLAQDPASRARDLFLVDYELLGYRQTGLDLIEQLGLKDRAVLVTSRYDEAVVRERCEKLGLKLLPKRMAPLVSLVAN